MLKGITWSAVAFIAFEGLAAGQGRDAGQVLGDARAAMGGSKLAELKTLSSTGRIQRTLPNGSTAESEFELALALPDRYLMRSVMVAMGSMSVYRNSGFNGEQVIEEIDRPPNLSGGHMVVRMAGPGGAAVDPEKMTAEQKAEFDKARLIANKKEFARLTLGMLASAMAVYPLEFTYAGEAESADGKADVLDVTGAGDFAARLFVDRDTHLPLMLTWKDKEPLIMQVGGPGMSVSAAGGTTTRVVQGGPGGPGAMSKEDREKFEQELDAKRKEAEATRRVVEYRVYYADYQDVGGIRLPHRIQRAIDGKTTEEMIVDEFKVNPKLDAKKFQVNK